MRFWVPALVLAACTVFGSDPDDAGSALDAGSASNDGGPLDTGTPAVLACEPWVTDPSVQTVCPGETLPRFLAKDGKNCGRCGYSCGEGACDGGHCVDHSSELLGVRLLGAGAGTAIVFREQTRQVATLLPNGEATPLGIIALGASDPQSAIVWGTRTYVRTGDSVVPYPTGALGIPFVRGPGTIAATDAGLYVPGLTSLSVFPHDTLVGGSVVAAADITEVAAAQAEPVVIVTPTGSAASLNKVGASSLFGLVADAGKARSLAAFGRDAFYADGAALIQVALDSGRAEVLTRAPGDIAAYLNRTAVAVTERAAYYVVSLDKAKYEVMAVERGCTSPVPRRMAFAENLAGIAVTTGANGEVNLFYVANTNTVRSQRIASK